MSIVEQAIPNLDEVELDLSVPFVKLSRDLKQACANIDRASARWLVDTFYVLQNDRIRSAAQARTSAEGAEPNRLVSWVFETMRRFEDSIKAALGAFAVEYRVGRWLQSQHGIGPVLSAALLTNFDIRRARTGGHFWRFAGLDPTLFWLGKEAAKKLLDRVVGDSKELTLAMCEEIWKASGQHVVNTQRVWAEGFSINGNTPKKKGKAGLESWLSVRPWNAKLKTICVFKAGECFVKTSGSEKSFYGKLYAQKKVLLTADNVALKFAPQAKKQLEEKNIGKQTEAFKHLSAGMLPPAQIHAQARRWAVKLFISHLHHCMYEDYYDATPPQPYIFEHPNGQDHRHLILPPNWSKDLPGKGLKELMG